eukprot:m.118464 g.118464  ORF g.118464 m.118464 type:complete len:240 (+) comp15564_c0_seq1:2901-3620(+)
MSQQLLQLREETHGLLGTIERYNPSNLEVFVDYVRLTIDENAYDLDAYLAVLKLYQFNPTLFDLETTCAVLTKALMGMPDNDFFLCTCLLTPDKLDLHEVKRIVYMNQLLESCRFEEFWKYLEDHAEILKPKLKLGEEDDGSARYESAEMAGFAENVRNYAAHVIQLTYQEASSETIKPMMGGIDDAALVAFAAEHEWQKLENDKWMVGNKEDVIRSKDIVEKIEFDALVPLMAAAQLR